MRTHILGARLIDPASGHDQVTDLFLEGGKVAAIGQAPAGFQAEKTLDAKGLVAAPGLVDLSVALREPGYSRKGTIASETLAVELVATPLANGQSLDTDISGKPLSIQITVARSS